MALVKNPNLTWMLLACMAAVLITVAQQMELDGQPISDFDYRCVVEFGTNIQPCYPYLEQGGDIPADCCDAVKANIKDFKTASGLCGCIQELSQGATESQMDRFFGLPAACVANSHLHFNCNTNCSQVQG